MENLQYSLSNDLPARALVPPLSHPPLVGQGVFDDHRWARVGASRWDGDVACRRLRFCAVSARAVVKTLRRESPESRYLVL